MRRIFLTLWIAVFAVPLAQSQDEETIQRLFQEALQVLGGDTFLKVTDAVSTGSYFSFSPEGESSIPIKYADYTKFPDKSRFEIGNRKNEMEITVFDLAANVGWIYDAAKGTRDAKPEEMKSFQNAVKHSLDNIMRFRYKDPENKLFYLGPGEDRDVTLEMVKIVDPDNDEVTVYFDRISKLPAKMEFRSVNSRGLRQRHTEEYSQWHMIQGVNTPKRIDSYINGRRSSQTFVDKITYSNNLPDSFFGKPVPPK
jgi:hypothetical protein